MLDTPQAPLATLATYCAAFPAEADVHASPAQRGFLALQDFLETFSGAALYSRKNFQGHLTASAFILDALGENVLLLHHRSLDKWLQPGGHIDPSDASILEAAYREVQEETKLSANQLQLVSLSDSPTIPFDIDSHVIPANSKKNEEAHVHHDFRFLLQLKAKTDITISNLESISYQWVSVHSLHKIEDHVKVSEKILAFTKRG